MSTHEHSIAMTAQSAGAGTRRISHAKAVAFETVQTFSWTASNALFAYAMTGSAVASLAVTAAPYLEMLLRCIFNGPR